MAIGFHPIFNAIFGSTGAANRACRRSYKGHGQLAGLKKLYKQELLALIHIALEANFL